MIGVYPDFSRSSVMRELEAMVGLNAVKYLFRNLMMMGHKTLTVRCEERNKFDLPSQSLLGQPRYRKDNGDQAIWCSV